MSLFARTSGRGTAGETATKLRGADFVMRQTKSEAALTAAARAWIFTASQQCPQITKLVFVTLAS